MRLSLAIVAVVGLGFSLACGGAGETVDGPRTDTIYLMCKDNGEKLLGSPGTTYHVSCPAMCGSGRLYGTDLYADDSSICKAGLHAGLINSAGGFFEVTLEEGSEGYVGSERNGIQSSDWDKPWDRSYTLQ